MNKLVFIVCLIYVQLSYGQEKKPLAVITAIDGDVKICRAINKELVPAGIEQGLFPDDSLITGEGAEVTILYNNGKIVSFGPKTGIKIVPQSDTIQRGNENQEDSIESPSSISPLFAFSATGERTGLKILVRGEEDSLTLKIYEPGNTALITNKPNFVWSKCTNAQSYIVMLQKMGNMIWVRNIQDTMLIYPDDVSELSPGSYLLKILATKDNDTIVSGERFIKILKPEVILEIEGLLKSIQKQNPDSFTLHFLSARIYEEKGLVFDAIREYEALLKIKPDEPLLHRSLSILYNKYGLIETGNRHLDRYEELTGKKK